MPRQLSRVVSLLTVGDRLVSSGNSGGYWLLPVHRPTAVMRFGGGEWQVVNSGIFGKQCVQFTGLGRETNPSYTV